MKSIRQVRRIKACYLELNSLDSFTSSHHFYEKCVKTRRRTTILILRIKGLETFEQQTPLTTISTKQRGVLVGAFRNAIDPEIRICFIIMYELPYCFSIVRVSFSIPLSTHSNCSLTVEHPFNILSQRKSFFDRQS